MGMVSGEIERGVEGGRRLNANVTCVKTTKLMSLNEGERDRLTDTQTSRQTDRQTDRGERQRETKEGERE